MVPTRIQHGWQILRYFGPSWLAYRMYYFMRMKTGLLRSVLPATSWDQQPLPLLLNDPSLADPERYAAYRRSSAPSFFFDADHRSQVQPLFAQWDHPENSPLIEASGLGEGLIRFFSHKDLTVGFPPHWHSDPLTSRAFPQDQHWTQIGDFDAGDIKLVWEMNRFGFVYSLVRSYWRTGNEAYPRLFWQLIESWRRSNPPQTGVNWKCGQEISLRVMSWCFGLYGFGSSPQSTAERLTKLAQMIAVSGQRIRANISYGLSQCNNHGISEAMGLWTIGTLFPEFIEAAEWASLGRELLERQANELIYDDGSFSQHSMNYHRVMLHDYLWSMRLADIQAQPFSDELRERICRSGEFLFQLQDEFTGDVPCYGQDDGALILPLSNCGYRDFRPVVQSISYLTTGDRRLSPGPWDEDLLWLFGSSAISPSRKSLPNHDTATTSASLTNRIRRLDAAHSDHSIQSSRRNFDANDGGYSTLRSAQGFASVRAAQFQHRPSQADLLHVDIWWRGENVAIDPGSFSYNAPAPWNNPFAHSAYHNTVTVDGRDQMDRAGRFMWLPWANGKTSGRVVPSKGDVAGWNGEHDGYRRLPDPVTHRRGIARLGQDHWLVVDALQGQKSHHYCLHWLLMDAPYQFDHEASILELQTQSGPYRVCTASTSSDAQLDVVRASLDSPRGWRSRFYHSREPAISLQSRVDAEQVTFATVLGPDVQHPVIEKNVVTVHGPDWTANVALSKQLTGPLIESINVGGSLLNPFSPIENSERRSMQEAPRCTYY